MPVAGLGCKWGLGAPGRTGEAPRGCSWVWKPSAAGEASPARKPLRRCPHYITDNPPLSWPPLREALLWTPRRAERLPVGPQSRQSRSFSPQGRQTERGHRGIPDPNVGRGAEGRWERAGGRRVKCGISRRAVVPDSLPSARGCLMSEYARDSPSRRYTHARPRAHSHTHTHRSLQTALRWLQSA